MAPGIIQKAESMGRYMVLLMEVLVIGLVFLLTFRYSVPATQIGLRLENWRVCLVLGAAVGLSWVGLQGVLVRFIPASKAEFATHHRQKGSVFFWVTADVVGAFAEESWLAFCLLALATRGYSVPSSVALTAAAFVAGHARTGFGGGLAKLLFATSQALLFVWQGSLLLTYSVHLISNLGGLYWIRQAKVSLVKEHRSDLA